MGDKKKASDFFQYNGTFYYYCGKLFDLLMLNAFWLIGCLPVLTIGASCGALYGSIVRCICGDERNAAAEFWRIYKRDLKKGILLWLAFAAAGFLLLLNLGIAMKTGTDGLWLFMTLVYAVLLSVLIIAGAYLFPALSRFEMDLGWYLRTAFFCVFRFLPLSLLLFAIYAFAYFVVLRCIPLALIVPALGSFLSHYFMETVLKKMEEGSTE